MTIRKIDSLGSSAIPDARSESQQSKTQITSNGFDTIDSIETQQTSLFDSTANIDQHLDPSHISTAASKLLADLPRMVREANSDVAKIADMVNDHVGQSFSNIASSDDADIGALVFIVLMEASKSAQEDLKSIMDGVKSINKQKEGWRHVQDEINKLTTSGSDSSDDDDK
jgi:hypothetical protein